MKANDETRGIISSWRVSITDEKGRRLNRLLSIALDLRGNRVPSLEKLNERVFFFQPGNAAEPLDFNQWEERFQEALRRDLQQKHYLDEGSSFEEELVALIRLD